MHKAHKKLRALEFKALSLGAPRKGNYKGDDGAGSRDDSGVSGDGGGDDEGSAVATAAMSASVVAAIGVWGQTDILALQSLGGGGGVGADSSVSNASVSLAEGTGSSIGGLLYSSSLSRIITGGLLLLSTILAKDRQADSSFWVILWNSSWSKSAMLLEARYSGYSRPVIMEYLVEISKKTRILELKRRYMKIIVLKTNMPIQYIVGIKSFLMLFGITTVLIDVNAAQSKLVLLENFNENYSKCLRLLYKVNAAEGVNAASEEVSTAELVSTAYVI
ncbi:hypothetical protein Tco_1407417, partial [Tanacetum coccineum]